MTKESKPEVKQEGKPEARQTYLILPDDTRQQVRGLSFAVDFADPPPIDLMHTSLPIESSGWMQWKVGGTRYRCHARSVKPPHVQGLDRIIRAEWDGKPEVEALETEEP